MTNTNFTTTPLPILFSCRVRLNDEQRDTLRRAHNRFRHQFAQPAKTPVLAGSTLQVETQHGTPASAYAQEGLSDLVISDILGSRETISLPIILKLERLLDVKVVTREDLDKAFSGYLDYLAA